jgi:hypothetical protein
LSEIELARIALIVAVVIIPACILGAIIVTVTASPREPAGLLGRFLIDRNHSIPVVVIAFGVLIVTISVYRRFGSA